METLDELWIELLDHLVTAPKTTSRVGDSRELTGWVGRLEDPRACFIFNPRRKLSPSYAAAELLWYLTGTNDTTMLQHYAPQYEQFTEDGRHAWGAYGSRMRNDTAFKTELFRCVHDGSIKLDQDNFFQAAGSYDKSLEMVAPITQLQAVAALLKKYPDSRQAVVALWNAGDLPHAIARSKKDLPCTLVLQFLLRDNKLNLIVTMRSNDVWLGFPYDVWCFAGIQNLIAESLGVELGYYQHQAGSMHLYTKNERAAEEAINQSFSTGFLEYKPHRMVMRESIQEALSVEKWNREHGMFSLASNTLGEGSFLHECLAMAASKWTDVSFHNSALEKQCLFLKEATA